MHLTQALHSRMNSLYFIEELENRKCLEGKNSKVEENDERDGRRIFDSDG